MKRPWIPNDDVVPAGLAQKASVDHDLQLGSLTALYGTGTPLNNTCERRTKLKPRRVTVADAVPSVTISGVIDSIAGCGDSTGFGSGWPGPTGRLPLKRPPLPLKATGRNA